mgnify:CR=1 FL=1
MKRLIFAAAAISASFAALPADAQTYNRYPPYVRYCVDTSFDDVGPLMICQWETLAQCRAARTGPHERCFLNPAFANENPRPTHRR